MAKENNAGIQLRKGLEANLPAWSDQDDDAVSGEPLYTTDTMTVYIAGGQSLGVNIPIASQSPIETVTASSVTLDLSQHFILADTSSNAITINLPAVADAKNHEYYIKYIDNTNTLTIDADGTELIDDNQTFIFTGKNEAYIFKCDGTKWYVFSDITRTVNSVTSTSTVTNTVTETTVFTGDILANSLSVGDVLKFDGYGTLTTANGSDSVTVRVKLGSTTIATQASATGVVTDEPLHIHVVMTVRSIGASGTISSYIDINISGGDNDTINESTTIDTTVSEDLTVTAQWDNADVGNIFDLMQGFLQFKN